MKIKKVLTAFVLGSVIAASGFVVNTPVIGNQIVEAAIAAPDGAKYSVKIGTAMWQTYEGKVVKKNGYSYEFSHSTKATTYGVTKTWYVYDVYK